MEEGCGVNRRQLLLHAAVAVPAFVVPNALALSGGFLIFYLFKIKNRLCFFVL